MKLVELKQRLAPVDNIYLKLFILAVCLGLFIAFSTGSVHKKKARVEQKKQEFTEFSELKKKYLYESSGLKSSEKKLLNPSKASVGTMIEEMENVLGIKNKITSFKPVQAKVQKGYTESGMEVEIKGLTLNQMANLLYRINNNRSLLLIKNFEMNSRYDEPNLVDITMLVALVTREV